MNWDQLDEKLAGLSAGYIGAHIRSAIPCCACCLRAGLSEILSGAERLEEGSWVPIRIHFAVSLWNRAAADADTFPLNAVHLDFQRPSPTRGGMLKAGSENNLFALPRFVSQTDNLQDFRALRCPSAAHRFSQKPRSSSQLSSWAAAVHTQSRAGGNDPRSDENTI